MVAGVFYSFIIVKSTKKHVTTFGYKENSSYICNIES